MYWDGSTTEDSYENGLRIESVDTDDEGVVTVTTFEYDENDNLKSQVTKDAVGNLIRTYTYTYDGKNNCITEVITDKDNQPTKQTTYTYDENGYRTGYTSEFADGSTITNTVKYYTNGEKSESRTEYKNHDGSVSELEEYTYYENGNYKSSLTVNNYEFGQTSDKCT